MGGTAVGGLVYERRSEAPGMPVRLAPRPAVLAGREPLLADLAASPVEDEQLRGEHSGRYGYLAYADPDLLSPNTAHPETPEKSAADQAPEDDQGNSEVP
jgi:hypothetical protein